MKTRLAALGAALILPLVAGPLVATSPASATTHVSAVVMQAGCTKTSSGTCIRGGQFCPQASFGRAGYDAAGRRYTCKGNRTHPHWMR